MDRWTGKSKLDFKARQVVKHFDICAVKTGNGSDNAEPQSVTGTVTASFEPIETFENVSMLFNGNSRPIVGHRYDGVALTLGNFNRHLNCFTRMLDGIVHKIGNCVEQKITIA